MSKLGLNSIYTLKSRRDDRNASKPILANLGLNGVPFSRPYGTGVASGFRTQR